MLKITRIILLLMFTLSMASCTQKKVAPYVYTPLKADEQAATIEGTNILSDFDGGHVGNIHVSAIDGKEILDIDGSPKKMVSTDLFAPPVTGKRYRLNPGKRIVRATVLKRTTGHSFGVLLNAKPGEHYQFKVNQFREDRNSKPQWKFWIENSSGQVVVEERYLKVITRIKR